MIDPLHLLAAFGAGFAPFLFLGFFTARQAMLKALASVVLVGGANVLAHQFFGQASPWEVGAFLLGGLPGIAAGISMARYSMRKKRPAGFVAVPRKQRQRVSA